VIGIALVAGVVVAAAPAAKREASSWPVFRGNAQQTGVASARLPNNLEMLWTFATGDAGVEGGAAIADGVVYIGAEDEQLYALSLADGTLKWKYKAGPIKAAPAVHGDSVYVGDSDGLFHCVSTDKGTKRWTFETQGEITSGANFAVSAAGELSILFASHDETLYCLAPDGKPRWKFKTEGPVYGSLTVAGGRTFVAGCDSQLHVLDLAKGTQLSAVDLGGQSGATSAVLDDHLYVGTMTNQFLDINLKKSEVAWTFQPKHAREFYASPAVTEDLVIAGSRDRRIYAIDRKTGEEKWIFVTGDRIDASPVVVGDRVYAPSMDGKLYVLELKTGRQVQKVVVDAPIAASPAVVGDRLIVATLKGTVYCLGAKK
jgi:outer membrane protein assembly factor BamB